MRQKLALFCDLVEVLPLWSASNMRRLDILTEVKTHENVLLQLSLAGDGSGIRLRPLDNFPAEIKVEFPEQRFAKFSPGTYFRATIQVCQEHWPETGKPKGDPYLVASNIHVHRMEVAPGSDKPIHHWDKVS